MADLDRLLRSEISHAAARAVQPPDFSQIEHRGEQRRRRTRTRVAATAAAAVVVVAAGSVQVLSGRDAAPPTPVVPSPEPTPTPTATPTGWTGPVREGSSMPVVAQPAGRPDGRDAAVGGVDILDTRSGGYRRDHWTLRLRARPPRASTLDPARTVIEYGLVIDAEEDGDADCHIGISNDTPKAGDYRVWVTNLATGVTEERVGGPYGVPIDFSHPDEGGGSRTMTFFFLFGAGDNPCDLYIPSSYYAYASLTEAGQVTAWDYAPDASWLEMP